MRFDVVRDIQAVRRQRGAVRLQTADKPFGPAVGGLYNHIWPPLLKKPYNRACGAKGNRNQLPSAALPLWCLTAPPSPRKREHNKPQRSISLISSSRHSTARISPIGGDAAIGGRRGAFPTGKARLYGFPFAPLGRLPGFIIRGAF